MRVDRRGFLRTTGAVGVAIAAGAKAGAAPAFANDIGDMFSLGVASGDVTWSSVVLWTRLAPAPLEPDTGFGMDGAPVEVHWWMAASEADAAAGTNLIASGEITASAETGYAIHVDVTDLRPDTTYYYRFGVSDQLSPTGRTRTAPPLGAVSSARFAVINCQNLAGGNAQTKVPMYMHGYTQLAERDDIDFIVHLGDYIYEFGRAAHIPPRPVSTLEDYRTRYGQYKLQQALQEVHRLFPIYAVPDDHEFFNNVRGGELAPDQIDRFNAAIEAYWEHLPIRSRPQPRPKDRAIDQLALHRRIQWGRTLDIQLLDSRQHATRDNPLDHAQWQQLRGWLTETDATWSVIASGFPWAYVGRAAGGWNGVPSVRSEVTALLAHRKAADPVGFNPVMLSGDFHVGLVAHVRQSSDTISPLVATEFINTPMTSGTTAAFEPSIDPDSIRAVYNKWPEGDYTSYRGYSRHEVTPDSWTADYFLTDQQEEPGGAIQWSDRWRQAAGAPVGSIEHITG